MLENFKEIYDDELKNDDNFFRRRILNESDIRIFVYEICKRIVAAQPVIEAGRPEATDNTGGRFTSPHSILTSDGKPAA